jgi:hypothetical protein
MCYKNRDGWNHYRQSSVAPDNKKPISNISNFKKTFLHESSNTLNKSQNITPRLNEIIKLK